MERVKGTFKQNGSLQTRRKNEGKKIEKGRKKKEKIHVKVLHYFLFNEF